MRYIRSILTIYKGGKRWSSRAPKSNLVKYAGMTHSFSGFHKQTTTTLQVVQESGELEKFRSTYSIQQDLSLNSSYRIQTTSLTPQNITWREKLHHLVTKSIEQLLPKHYETSVEKEYLIFVKWSVLAGITGTISGVLSMEAMLFAVGLGAGALPMAAALNWIIKDGLGQFGGMLCASLINQRFDGDPKRWRLMAACLLDFSVLLEVLTPLFPQYFLAVSSVANVGKNVGWISASASRAGIHRSFMRSENLADITGKAGSQSIASSVLGTAIGVAISPLLGSSTKVIFPVVSILASFHIFCVYKSLGNVTIKTLNWQRLWLAVRDSSLVWKAGNQKPGPLLEPSIFLSPKEVASRERLIHAGGLSGERGYAVLEDHRGNTLKSMIRIGTDIGDLNQTEIEQFMNEINSKDAMYYLFFDPNPKDGRTIHLLFNVNATHVDVLKGVLHSLLVCELLEYRDGSDVQDILSISRSALEEEHFAAIMQQLSKLGWDLKYPFFEAHRKRVQELEA